MKASYFYAAEVATSVVHPREHNSHVIPLNSLTYPHSLNEKSEHEYSIMYTAILYNKSIYTNSIILNITSNFTLLFISFPNNTLAQFSWLVGAERCQ
jgi:hypothetical protein